MEFQKQVYIHFGAYIIKMIMNNYAISFLGSDLVLFSPCQTYKWG